MTMENVRTPFHGIFQNLWFYLFVQKCFNTVFGLDRKINGTLKEYTEGKDVVLDFGCGTGEYTHTGKKIGIGVDINDEYLRYAHKTYKGERRSFLKMSAIALGIKSLSVDVVYCSRFFHHLSDADIKIFLLEIGRVVKPGGKIVIFDGFDPGPSQPVVRFLLKNDRGAYIRSFDEMTALMNHNGAVGLEARKVEYPGDPFIYGVWAFHPGRT